MLSDGAKPVNGSASWHLARRSQECPREPVAVHAVQREAVHVDVGRGQCEHSDGEDDHDQMRIHDRQRGRRAQLRHPICCLEFDLADDREQNDTEEQRREADD
jgi:hypothetical protein